MTDFEMRCCELDTEIEHLRNRLADMTEERDELMLVVGDMEKGKRLCTSLLEDLQPHKIYLPMKLRFEIAALHVELNPEQYDDEGVT